MRRLLETALLPAPFWCTYAWNRPTSTGAGGSDPLWLCWRGKPWLAIHWRGYAASKWSQLERQLILGQRLRRCAFPFHPFGIISNSTAPPTRDFKGKTSNADCEPC